MASADRQEAFGPATSAIGGPGAVEPTEATAVVTAAGEVIGWTPGVEELLGYAPEEVVGRSGAFLFAGSEDRARTARILERCRTGPGWSGVTTARRRDGRRIEVAVQVSAAFRLAGQECFLVSGRERRPEWTIGQSVLDGFLTRSPIGMAVMSPDLRYVWLNDTLERFGGVPREQRMGCRLSEVVPGLEAEAIEAIMRRVMDTRVPVVDYEYQGWSWADPHRRHAYSTSFFPLVDAQDVITGVCYMVTDVTDRWNAQQRLALMNDAGAGIGSTLDVMRTAQELADVTVPRFADFVVVDLLESVLSGEPTAPAALGDEPPESTPRMRRAGMRSIHEGCPEAVVQIAEPVDFTTPRYDASHMFHGEAVFIPTLDPLDEAWATEQPERAANIRRFGLHTLISVPLRARETVLGVATFMRSENLASFERDDLLLAQELVARASVCIDNARRYSREHATALALQRSLLPRTLAGSPVMEVASAYLPADAKDGVGGDWFDVLPLSGARIALVVGDVVGHGITAAAAMGRLRTAVHTLADMELPPAELLAHLDDLVLRLTDEEPEDEPTRTAVLGATCLYAVYDPVTRHCELARAGHPPPVLVGPDGTAGFPDLPFGPPLGLGGLPFEAADMEVPEGSTIGLYTDGLIAASGQDVDAGMARLGQALAQPGLDLRELCDAAVGRLLPGPQPDDVALLLARPHPLTPEQVVTWDVPADPAAVAAARSLAARHLDGWGLGELAMTTELIVSELVTNAIRHATGPVRLRLLRQPLLIVEVSDASSTSPRLRHPRTTDEGGRGLFLVAQLARRWGTRYTDNGKIIWAEQDLPAGAPTTDALSSGPLPARHPLSGGEPAAAVL
ncbi:SpoIIE family protein phosphatase [Streptomyces sp. NPDC002566]|uniref:SpoIIE family protein phosphatase n=1 Tax=Streptomyces sp. NPDC002566 TaxID=3364650 RepID=UPI00368794FB